MKSIADKIRKILALADSTSHPEEAASFMEKAQEMLEAHGLSLLDLGRLDSDDPIGTDRNATKHYAADNWLGLVSGQLARFYGAELVSSRNKNTYQHAIVGRESARLTYQLMQPFVARQVRQLAKEGVKAGDYKTESRAKTAIGNALAYRIHLLAQVQVDRRKEDQPGKGLNALVPVDMIALEVADQFPNLRAVKNRTVSTSAASRETAEKVNLNLQTGHAKVKQIAAG